MIEGVRWWLVVVGRMEELRLSIAITVQSLGGVKWGHTPTFEIRVFKIAHVSNHMINCPQ